MSVRPLTLALIASALMAGAGPALADTKPHQSATPVQRAVPADTRITIDNSWVRGTVAGQKATGAFMQLRAAADSRLVGASSPVTSVVQIHTMRMEDGVMRMREIPGLDLPAGKTVELAPGSYHIMLMDLSTPLQKGQTIPLTLKLQGADGKPFEQTIAVPVRALGTHQHDGHTHHHHHDGHGHHHKKDQHHHHGAHQHSHAH